jgi:hypothetical protein
MCYSVTLCQKVKKKSQKVGQKEKKVVKKLSKNCNKLSKSCQKSSQKVVNKSTKGVGGWGGQIVVPRPSASASLTGRRQKGTENGVTAG